MSGTEVRAELLSPAEIDSALTSGSIVYIPLGSLEFHQAHLPIGLDSLNAHGVCAAAAAITGGVVLPTVYLGTGGGHGDYPWFIMMPTGDALEANLTATLERLDEFGVRVAVVFSGHFADEQLELVDRVGGAWAASDSDERDGRRMQVVTTSVNRCPTAPLAPDHAGTFETTLLHGLVPGLVHLERLPSLDDAPAIDDDQDPQGAQRHDPANPLWGVFGPDPRRADLSKGAELVEAIAGWLADSVRERLAD